MRIHIIVLLVAVLALISCNQNRLTIEGNIIQSEAKSVTLEIMDGAKRTVLDKAKIADGQFTLSARLKSKKVLGIYIDNELLPAKKLERSQGNIKIFIDHKENKEQYEESRRLFGVQREFLRLGSEFREEDEKLRAQLRIARGLAKNSAEKKQAEKEDLERYNKLKAEHDKKVVALVKENTHTEWGLHKLFSISNSLDKKTLLELLEMFRPHFERNRDFKNFERYATMERMRLNEKALDFTLKDVNGKDVKLSDYKGKVVIVDFWASWCAPCRAANPHVKSLYAKYKSKGLEIIGVSLDSDEDAWKKAIKDDGLPWIQLSSLKGFDCPVGSRYGVKAIPHVFVIDREGIYRAEKLHGPDLEEKIKELL